MAYRLTRLASEQVVGIYLTGLAEFGQTAAERYQDGLEKVFEFLADYPRAARERTEIDPPVRAHPYKAHLVVYIVEANDDILILGIRHGRDDWMDDAAPGRD